MNTITTPIIPTRQTFAKVSESHVPNLEAICVFMAIGFFLDQDTYWRDEVVLRPGTTNKIDKNGYVFNSYQHFSWYYEPRPVNFKTALDEFTNLFESIVLTQTGNKKVILPLSGGLDSRTQAAGLKYLGVDVHAYSYSFTNGFQEHAIGKQIAEACGFQFTPFLVPPNYLWDAIDDIASINGCYSEFTNPRQMAVFDALKKMQGEFSLGHWGDVLFDRGYAKADEKYSDLDIIYKKLVKKGGLELATKLWKYWGLEGDFEDYLRQRIQDLLNTIDINNKSSKIRAFKSLYWAPRWTSVSLDFFEAAHPINLPYYHDKMCQFICEIPEAHLADRKIQIEYIKKRNPDLAKIAWQDHMPYNLYSYPKNQYPKNLPYRIRNKIQREFNALLGKKYIQRNWELQFLGQSNESKLNEHLFNSAFLEFIGNDVVSEIYSKFKTEDAVYYSHAVSMLLTLSLWCQKENNVV